MKICEAFRHAGFWFRVADHQFRFTCACGVQQQLDGCPTSERDEVTVYTCPHCGQVVAGIATADAVPAGAAPGSRPDHREGHQMCGYVFGTTVDMELWPAAAAEPFLRIPQRPAFFTSRNLPQGRSQAS